jgi:hypothetical protein
MQVSLASLAQVEALSGKDAQKMGAVHLDSALEPPTLPPREPREYPTEIWQSLRPYLMSRGYRLITQRDVALEASEATNEPIPEHWNGPPKDDDELYSASSVHLVLFFSSSSC